MFFDLDLILKRLTKQVLLVVAAWVAFAATAAVLAMDASNGLLDFIPLFAFALATPLVCLLFPKYLKAHVVAFMLFSLIFAGWLAQFTYPPMGWIDETILDYEHKQSAAAFELAYEIEKDRLPTDVQKQLENCIIHPAKADEEDLNEGQRVRFSFDSHCLGHDWFVDPEERWVCDPEVLLLIMTKALENKTSFSVSELSADANELQKETHRVYQKVYAFMDFAKMRRVESNSSLFMWLTVWRTNEEYLSLRKSLESDFRALARKYGYTLYAFELEG